MEIRAPTGTNTPTEPDRAGTQRNNKTINIMGAKDIFQFLLTYTTANPPNREGSIFSNAGFKTGELMIGASCAKSNTPIAITIVVTMDEVATAIVEIISPSSDPDLTLAFSIALKALGTLRFVRLPVTKAR
jgi:hypothetical protein